MNQGKTFFKVCRRIGRELFSSIVSNKYRLTYAKGKWTFPVIGKIFVFDSLEAAKKFAEFSFSGSYAIYPCEVKNPVESFQCSSNFLEEDFDKFWLGEASKMFIVATPPGTWTVDAVKIFGEDAMRRPEIGLWPESES